MAEHKGFTRLKADLKAEQMQNVYILQSVSEIMCMVSLEFP